MKASLRPALMLFFLLTLLCAVFYPLFVTLVGQVIFSKKVNGSMLMRGEKLVGSSLIGQSFSSPKYFWGRPSATTPMPNNAMASSGSNLSTTNPARLAAIRERLQRLKEADPNNVAPIPIDLVSASASGLDPEISLAAAYYQAPRVAKARQMSLAKVNKLIAKYSKLRYLDVWGEPRVNIMKLNLALDQP